MRKQKKTGLAMNPTPERSSNRTKSLDKSISKERIVSKEKKPSINYISANIKNAGNQTTRSTKKQFKFKAT